MESEPHRKRLKLSLTKKRPSHDSESIVAGATEETAVATAECQDNDTEAPTELSEADASPKARQLESELEAEPGNHQSEGQEYREAYYSANFKSILKTVLSDSPARHVISENGAKVVERFMALPGTYIGDCATECA